MNTLMRLISFCLSRLNFVLLKILDFNKRNFEVSHINIGDCKKREVYDFNIEIREIREILNVLNSTKNHSKQELLWSSLMDLLRVFPEDLLDIACNYIENHSIHVLDKIRIIPMFILKYLVTGKPLNRVDEKICLLGRNIIDFDFSKTSSKNFHKLITSSALSNLKYLHLRYSNIGTEGLLAIANSKEMKNLISLDVAINNIGVKGIKELGNSKYIKNLEYLYLESNSLGSEALVLLCNSKNFQNLKVLELGRNNIGLEGLQSLVSSKYLESLEELFLESNSIDSEGAYLFTTSNNLIQLKMLVLDSNNISSSCIEALRCSELSNHTNIIIRN